jgi:transcriptional regulator with XRE-family HTH domain
VGSQGKSAMKKSQAKAKRVAGLRQWRLRIEGSPMQLCEEATDRRIGLRLRELRLLRGMTLQQLGAAIGLSYQGVQRYEAGRNAITAARLEKIAETLGVPVTYFFDAEAVAARDDDPPMDTLRLAGKFRRIEEHTPGGLSKLRDLINAMAKDKA